jgi:N-acetylneuraminic acid mutarotase
MGIATTNNKIFIAGGGTWGDGFYTERVDIYNASNNTWSISALSEARAATVGISAGNKVLFAGGISSHDWSNTVDIYDDSINGWTTATLTERRGYINAVVGGNKIYFVGGARNDGQYVALDRIDEYDMTTGSWSMSSLREPLVGLAAIAAGNKVFFAGGFSNSHVSGNVEIRDVATGAVSYNCIIPRSGLSAVLKDDKVIFFTGYGNDGRNGTHFEIYNLTTDTWRTGVLDKKIQGAAMIYVNNIIYVAGGYVNEVGSDQVWKLEF